ncbi:MAG: hypothetical protein Q7U04_16775 [Bacteriovorax sp.]|nr:hypothetical protein [Bacteriovorax sp.]
MKIYMKKNMMMKIIFLVGLMLSGTFVLAQEASETPADKCIKKKQNAEKAIEDLTSSRKVGKLDNLYGSRGVHYCDDLTLGNFRDLYKNGSATEKVEKWKDYLTYSKTCMTDICDDNKYKACIDKLKPIAASCDAAAYIVSAFDRDWNAGSDKPVDGGTPKITCKRVGAETLDFDGCVSFVQNGELMDVAQTVVQKGQEVYFADKSMTAQAEAAQSTNTATAGLTALKSNVKGQQDIMTQRAVLDTGKLAALATYYSEIPSVNTIYEKCASYRTVVNPEAPGPGPVEICNNTAKDESKFGFLQNQTAKEKMKAKLASVGINVASDAMMASLMAKRVGDLDNAIAKVETFKPIDPLAPSADNLQSTYCQQNPGDAQCLTGGLDRTFDAMGDNMITFGDGGTGTSYMNKNPDLNAGAGTTNAVNPAGTNKNDGVASIVSGAQQKGGLAETAAKAVVTKGTMPTGGGGGGGSLGGGGGGGGGGSAPGAAAATTFQEKAPTYGGGGGTLSMMGGLGINKNRAIAKDDSNPFGKLFNKDASKSGALDFGRSPASQKVGNKTDNLFEMISKRYTNVNTEKRLIEYELTK